MVNSTSEFERLSIELFRVFARFEYALKATEFHTGDGNAQANWQEFALSIEGLFSTREKKDMISSVDYILNNPPKKQFIKDRKICWVTVEPQHVSKRIWFFFMSDGSEITCFTGANSTVIGSNQNGI